MSPRLLSLVMVLAMSLGVVRAQIVISEFMASNAKTLADADGDFSDWIEVQNTSGRPVNLLGWSLTDRPNLAAKWRFPATNLDAGAFLVVFASGKDRTNAGAPLHLNFRLSANGDYLGLFPPDSPASASEFAPVYPPQ